ncbi:hypothetical protein BGW36DRAFT_433745 [Talaromyces proteolyticus]|uniref:Uncharacterized protein n=1 Tax=Talaromyces proteolyticus TaxID=1131652 RepID=A0AAD4KCW5_9EURO|nr:uncharacterized protein BGW36DRAFT_433745 [Talaromyces proteolyticus]KAH8688974.1 hypothetical protein BGW36DRAFT_433745 [Talaromyces proteolyticus]
MLRKRIPLAPSELTDTHKRAICQHPEILELKREKKELLAEMRSLACTVKNTQKSFPHLIKGTKLKDYFPIAPVLELDRQIKRLLCEHEVETCDADSSDDENWELPNPKYVFPERAGLVEIFCGPEAENYDEDKLLARRIQVAKDMVALLRLCEPSRRGNRVDWKFDYENDEPPDQPEGPSPREEYNMKCLMDVCIICYVISYRSASNPPPHRSPSKRPDSLRRHLIDSYLLRAHTRRDQLQRIKLCHLSGMPQFILSDGPSGEASTELETQQATETPASSLNFDIANLDPLLMESGPITVVKSNVPTKPLEPLFRLLDVQ